MLLAREFVRKAKKRFVNKYEGVIPSWIRWFMKRGVLGSDWGNEEKVGSGI